MHDLLMGFTINWRTTSWKRSLVFLLPANAARQVHLMPIKASRDENEVWIELLQAAASVTRQIPPNKPEQSRES